MAICPGLELGANNEIEPKDIFEMLIKRGTKERALSAVPRSLEAVHEIRMVTYRGGKGMPINGHAQAGGGWAKWHQPTGGDESYG